MLMRYDPFRDLDRLAQQMSMPTRPSMMPMDAYRHGDEFVVHFDLPGVDPSSIDLTIERGGLTVSAERSWQPADDDEVIAAERPQGRFSRELLLGENLDADRIEARYEQGVLTVTIPVAERAKPRRVEISTGDPRAHAIGASSS